jgi:hypothetical protein
MSKIRKLMGGVALALAGAVVMATVAIAAVSFDPATGTGFVGKGDVQLVFGWNNKALQDNAGSVQFRASTEQVSTSTWTCDRDAGPQTQERANTTTTTTQGIVDSIARERNQITGFNLTGYFGAPETDTEHEGPAVGSCPTGWTAIDLVTEEGPSSSTLQVSIGGDWFDLQ